jgi:hypothetical protein
MGFGQLVKDAFSATQTGQAIQRGKENNLALQQQKEQNERDFADYVQSRGARPVQNGMVHRDWTSGNGSVIPNAIFDKAGVDGRQVINHKDPITGEKIQWELPTPDEQVAHQTALKIHQQMLEQPIRQTTANEGIDVAGRTEGAKMGAQLSAQQGAANTERDQHGLTLPDTQRALLGIAPDQAGRKYLPAELSQLLTGADQAATTQATVASKDQATAAAKASAAQLEKMRAWQDLSTATDQEGYDAVKKAHPEATADWQQIFNPNLAKQKLKGVISPEDQLKYGLINLSDTTPEDWDKRVDQITTDPNLNRRARTQIHAILDNPGEATKKTEAMQKVLKDTTDEANKPDTALKTENMTSGAKIAQAVATAKQLRAGDNPAVQKVPPSEVGSVMTAAQKLDQEALKANSATEAMGRFLDLADSKNVAAGANIALAGVAAVNAVNGIKRINSAELSQYGSAGNLVQKIQGKLEGWKDGEPVPASVRDDIRELHQQLGENSYKNYVDGLKSLNDRTGAQFQPNVPPPNIRKSVGVDAKVYTQADVDAAVKAHPGLTPKDADAAFKAKGWAKK